tara:strand:+ start:6561 stop:7046 length:486 start_codon:yes stop_codon:yes gene_type:complete
MSDLADPLAALGEVDMTSVDTSMPLLVPGTHVVRVAHMEVAESKAKPGRNNLVVTLETTEDIPAHESDRVLNAGWKLKQYYPMQNPDPNPNGFDFRENIARFMDAVLGTNRTDRPAFDTTYSDYLNKEVIAVVSIREITDETGSKTGMLANDVRRLSNVDA